MAVPKRIFLPGCLIKKWVRRGVGWDGMGGYKAEITNRRRRHRSPSPPKSRHVRFTNKEEVEGRSVPIMEAQENTFGRALWNTYPLSFYWDAQMCVGMAVVFSFFLFQRNKNEGKIQSKRA